MVTVYENGMLYRTKSNYRLVDSNLNTFKIKLKGPVMFISLISVGMPDRPKILSISKLETDGRYKMRFDS